MPSPGFKFAIPRLLLTLAVFSLFASNQSFAAPPASEHSDWSMLSQGKVVVKQNTAPSNTMPSVEARVLIEHPPERVWPIVANPEKLMSQEQKVKKVKILSQEGNTQQVSFSVFMTRLLPTFNYVLEQNLFPSNIIRFHRISGSFRDVQGFWRLVPSDNGKKTILVYNLKLDPGPLVPRTLLLSAVKADLPNMMRNVKQAIELNSR